MTDMRINFAGIPFKNPIALASGTCGFGKRLEVFYDIEKLGGISTKGLTLNGSLGNKGIRIWETPAGIMNSVGLENPSVRGYIEKYNEYFKTKDLVHIINLSGHCHDDYIEGIKLLDDCDFDLLEVNISCPNVKSGGMSFGVKTEIARELIRDIRKVCKHKLMVKLSPNAEDIADMAKMCEEEGADAISLVNTFLAMAIDIKRRKPIFNNTYAGLSGPAIKPIALRMVHQVAKAVSIPVMGMGGIMTAEDVLEFMMAGATAIQLGTANIVDPNSAMKVIDDLNTLSDKLGIERLEDIIGII